MTQEDLVDILQAFGSSAFARMELRLGSMRVAANRAPAAAHQVAAPLLGIFQAALVQPGTKVHADTTIGIIRVMKDETAVKAGVHGTVVDVLVQDGQFVEYGQPLLCVSTDAR